MLVSYIYTKDMDENIDVIAYFEGNNLIHSLFTDIWLEENKEFNSFDEFNNQEMLLSIDDVERLEDCVENGTYYPLYYDTSWKIDSNRCDTGNKIDEYIHIMKILINNSVRVYYKAMW